MKRMGCNDLAFLLQVVDAIMNYKKQETEDLLVKLNIKLSVDDREKDGKALLKGEETTITVIRLSQVMLTQTCTEY